METIALETLCVNDLFTERGYEVRVPIVASVLALLCTALIATVLAQHSSLGDFRALYCAGLVQRLGADPYLAQPLHRCELATMSPKVRAHWTDTVIPAPLPPYGLAPFSGLSLMPFADAAAVWMALLLAAYAAAVAALRVVTRLPGLGIACALLLSVLGSSLFIGQLAPIAIAAVCVAGWCVVRQRWIAAGVFAAASLIEPHVGVPLCLSFLVWLPRVRVATAISATVLALLSLTSGLHANAEYFSAVLPAHALSEIGSNEQYGLSVLLYAAGLAAHGATFAGSVWYVAMLVAGVAAARAAAWRSGEVAYYAFVPPAFAVLGGPFIHLTQIAVAIPAALLVYARVPRQRVLMAAALILLALPWPMAQSVAFSAAAALLTFVMIWSLCGGRFLPAIYAAISVAVVALLFNRVFVLDMTIAHAPSIAPAIDPHLAESSWAALMSAKYSSGDAASWYKRIPTWIGLLATVSTLAAFSSQWSLRSKNAAVAVSARNQEA